PRPSAEGRSSNRGRGSVRQARSPDDRWTAFVEDCNVFIRAADSGEKIQFSKDGKTGLAYGMLNWSADSKTLIAFRLEPAAEKPVYVVESSPKDGGRAKLHSRPYPLPGDAFPSYGLNLFDVATHKQIKPAVDRIDFGFPEIHWSRDGRQFTYEKVDRGHQRLRVIEIDAASGSSRNLIDEKSKTFIWTAHNENLRLRLVNYLNKSDEIICASEQAGWRHLY